MEDLSKFGMVMIFIFPSMIRELYILTGTETVLKTHAGGCHSPQQLLDENFEALSDIRQPRILQSSHLLCVDRKTVVTRLDTGLGALLIKWQPIAADL